MISRLRAMLTPRVLMAVFSLMLALWLMRSGMTADFKTDIEKRISGILSSMSGAGKVEVVILTRTIANQSAAGMHSMHEEEVPCGAVAVAQGADDPFIKAQIVDALCALLGLPASSVSVVTGGM